MKASRSARVGRVERQVRAAGLEHRRAAPTTSLRRALQAQRPPAPPGPRPARAVVRQPVGPRVELARRSATLPSTPPRRRPGVRATCARTALAGVAGGKRRRGVVPRPPAIVRALRPPSRMSTGRAARPGSAATASAARDQRPASASTVAAVEQVGGVLERAEMPAGCRRRAPLDKVERQVELGARHASTGTTPTSALAARAPHRCVLQCRASPGTAGACASDRTG